MTHNTKHKDKILGASTYSHRQAYNKGEIPQLEEPEPQLARVDEGLRRFCDKWCGVYRCRDYDSCVRRMGVRA